MLITQAVISCIDRCLVYGPPEKANLYEVIQMTGLERSILAIVGKGEELSPRPGCPLPYEETAPLLMTGWSWLYSVPLTRGFPIWGSRFLSGRNNLRHNWGRTGGAFQ